MSPQAAAPRRRLSKRRRRVRREAVETLMWAGRAAMWRRRRR
jgi:hypothetical protein